MLKAKVTPKKKVVAKVVKRVEKPVLEILREFNDKNLEKGEIKKPKHKTYKLLINKLEYFLKTKKLVSIPYKNFDYPLLDEAIRYLKITRFDKGKVIQNAKNPVQNDTLRPLVQFLKRANMYALRYNYTKTMLPEYDQMKSEAGQTNFLTWYEVESLEDLDLSQSVDLEGIRDIFLFSCYTGLLFCDMRKFDYKKHVEIDTEGVEWIIKPREKNGNKQNLIFIDKAKAILVKWNYNFCFKCDQTHNRDIKILCKQVGITKTISNMCGRKTAGQIWLNMGYDMITVSNMLGHESIKITQKHYAHVQRSRILRETNIINAQNELLQKATTPNKEDLIIEVLRSQTEAQNKTNALLEKLANKE